MEHKDDNFDALFARFKQAIRERREPKTVRTMSHDPLNAQEATFDTLPIYPSQDFVGVLMEYPRVVVGGRATRDDLINIAEHCLLRAAQFPHADG